MDMRELDRQALRLADRRLFISVMRHPKMRVLRLALKHLRDDAGRDWRAEIQEAEIVPADQDSPWWIFQTNRYTVAIIRPEDPNLTNEDFLAILESDLECLEEAEAAMADEFDDGVYEDDPPEPEDEDPLIVRERERALCLSEEMARELAEEPGPPYILRQCEDSGQHGDDCYSVFRIKDPDDCVQAHVTYAAAYHFIYGVYPPTDDFTDEVLA